MKEKIAVVGSANIDRSYYVERLPKEGETLSSLSTSESLGGKGLNQVVAAARAGGKTAFFASVGKDESGQRIADLLEKEGIENHLSFCDCPTGSASICVDKGGHNQIVLNSGANALWAIQNLLPELMRFDDIVFQKEIPAGVDGEFILYLHQRGKRIFLNPAPARSVETKVLAAVDFILPNEHELSLLSVGDGLLAQSRHLLDCGVGTVLTTLGDKGSFLLSPKESIRCLAKKAKAIDTVAAGDTFVGYFVSALAEGFPYEKAMNLASEAAAICVTRKGAIPSIPYRRELGCC